MGNKQSSTPEQIVSRYHFGETESLTQWSEKYNHLIATLRRKTPDGGAHRFEIADLRWLYLQTLRRAVGIELNLMTIERVPLIRLMSGLFSSALLTDAFEIGVLSSYEAYGGAENYVCVRIGNLFDSIDSDFIRAVHETYGRFGIDTPNYTDIEFTDAARGLHRRLRDIVGGSLLLARFEARSGLVEQVEPPRERPACIPCNTAPDAQPTECAICFKLIQPIDWVTTNCGHGMCVPCSWQLFLQTDTVADCPFCRGKVTELHGSHAQLPPPACA